jgi:hypothetical protein
MMLRQIYRLRFAEIGIATLLLVGCLRQSTKPSPPNHEVSQTARAAVVDYSHRLADSFAHTAEQLAANTLTTAAETNAKLQAANADARKQAFHPLDQRLNDELGGDQWDADKAKEIFEHIARGLRSVR